MEFHRGVIKRRHNMLYVSSLMAPAWVLLCTIVHYFAFPKCSISRHIPGRRSVRIKEGMANWPALGTTFAVRHRRHIFPGETMDSVTIERCDAPCG